MKFFDLVANNYQTYWSEVASSRESHWLRLAASLLVSCILAVSTDDASAAYPIMVTGITILTGFTFSALFSDQVLADVGLPKAINETDRIDLKRLDSLSKNFKARSRYFISFSIIDAILLIAASLSFGFPSIVSNAFSALSEFIEFKSGVDFFELLGFLPELFSNAFFILVIFLFLECLYTFYRLSETIVAIVDTRREYLKAAEERPG